MVYPGARARADPSPQRAQALVEFALVVPILLLLLLGFAEVATFAATRWTWQDDVGALADWSAANPSGDPLALWSGFANDCDGTPVVEDVDGVLVATVTCAYTPRLTTAIGAAAITVSGRAVPLGRVAAETASPVPSGE